MRTGESRGNSTSNQRAEESAAADKYAESNIKAAREPNRAALLRINLRDCHLARIVIDVASRYRGTARHADYGGRRMEDS